MDGQNVINEIAFSQSVINIGSDSGNDIVLRGAKVADFHAMLNYAGSTWHLIPLDPGYPVLLNGRGIGPEGSTLPTGSVLSIGDYRLTVSVNGMNADILVAQTAPLPGDVKEAGTPEETSGKNILLTITAPGTYEVETGNTVEYELTVTNAGPLVANMQIQLQGVPSAWVQIIPPVLNLNEARKGTFQVRISPPRDPSSEAGEYHLHFVAISPNYPGETATADTSLMVLPFRQFLLNGPNPRRLNLKRTHREDYSDVVILNQSNSECTYMVRSFDDGNELNYAYKLENDSLVQGQDTITVPAGESQRVPVQVGARKAPVFGFIDHVHHYYTSVTPTDDPVNAQSVVGEVHVRPLINGFWLVLFILLILLLGLFIFQPYIYQFSTISGKQTEVIIAGESVTVDWRTSHFASNVTLTEGTGGNPETVDQSGSMVLTPKVSTTYRLKAANLLSRLIGLTYEKELNVLLIPARPSIDLFSTDIKEAYFEQPVNLKWAVGENAETAFMVINKQRTDLTKENYSGSQENKFNSDTLLWMRAQNQSGYETKSLFVNVDPDKINLNRFTAWVRPNGIAVPSDNDVRRTTRWGSLANLYGTVPTPQTLRPANVNPMPAPQSNVLEIPDNYGTAPYTGAVSPEQQLLSGSDNGLNPSAAELLVSPSLVSTPAAPATAVPMIQAPMRTPVASATAPASSPERAVNREFSIKLAEVIEDPMSENGYRTIWYFDNYVLQKGEQVLIDWEVSGVPNVKIENLSADPVGASGSDFVYPEKNTNYTLEAEIGSLKKNFTLPLLVAGDADNGEGSGLNCELKANATTLTVPGSVMLTWSGGGSNRVQLISSAKAESENADAEKKKEAEAKEKGEPYTKPTNAPLEGGIIGDWLQPAGFMRVNVDKQTTFVLNAYDGNGNVICTKSAEVKYTGGNDKLDLKMKISKIADMDDNETKTFYVGQTAQFTVAFSDFEKGKDPTGSVMITDGDSTCSVTLPKDTCSMVLKHEGTRKITAVYSGDNTYNKLTSTGSVTVINKRSLQLDITKVSDDFPDLGGVSQPYYVVGQDIFYTVNLSKHLKGRIPTGTIKISDGTGTCTVTWPDQKTCSIKAAKAGENIRVTAEYSGDEVYKPATAETTVEVLTKRPITFKITKVTDSAGNESKVYKLGQKYRVYTELSDTAPELDPSGTIMITDGLSTCTVTLPDNACDLEAKKVGNLTVKAVYSGDANYVTKVAETTINVTEKIPTTLELTQTENVYPLRKLDGTADLEAILSWSKDAAGTLKPTGTITFSTFGSGNEATGTCVLDLKEKTVTCDSDKPILTEKEESITSVIKNMLLADKNATRVRAEYSGDGNFRPSKTNITPFEIQQKIPTKMRIDLAYKPGALYANLYDMLLSWDDDKAKGAVPTGTINLTFGSDASTVCKLDIETKNFDCTEKDKTVIEPENLTPTVPADPDPDATDPKCYDWTSLKYILLKNKSADRVKAEYSGDDLFDISSVTVMFTRIPTEITIDDFTLKSENTANITLTVKPKEDVPPDAVLTGKITFRTGGGASRADHGSTDSSVSYSAEACDFIFDPDTKRFEYCSVIGTVDPEVDPYDPNIGYKITIKDLRVNGKYEDSITAIYSGDALFESSTSPSFSFDSIGKIDTLLDIAAIRDTDNKLNVTAVLHWEAMSPDGQNPTGIITFTSDSSCSVNLATGKFEKCSGSGDPDDPTKPKIEFDPENKLVRITATDMSISTGTEIYAEYSGDTVYNKSVSPSVKIEKRDPGLKILRILDEEGNERKAFIAGGKVRIEIGFENAIAGLEPSGSVTVNIDTVIDTIQLPQKTKILTLSSTPGLNWEAVAVYPNGDTYYKNDSYTLKPVKTITKHTPVLTLHYTNEDGHEENYVGDTIKITASVTVNDPNSEMAAFLRGLFADSPEDIVVTMGSQTCTIENYPENYSCTITTNKEVSGNITAKYPENYYFNEAEGTKAITVVKQQPELTIRHTNSEGVEQESYYVGETIRVYADLAADVTDEQKAGEIKITLGSSTCSINYPGEEYCTLETAGDGALEIKGVFDGNDYLKPDDDTAEIIIGKNAIKLEIEKVVNAENEIEQVDDYYVTGQKIRVWIRLYDAEGGYDQTGTINIKAAESEAISCTIYPAPEKQYCDIELGDSYTGDVNLTAEYSGNTYYPARTSAPKKIVVKEPIEPILSFRYAYLAIDDENNVKLKLELSENYFNEYSISPLIDETYDPPRPGTIRFTMTDPSGSSSDSKVCELDLTTGDGDAEAALGDDCIINGATATYHKESVEIYGVKSYLFTITGMLNPFGSGAKIKAEYLGSDYDSGGSYKFNRYFLSASDEYPLNPGDKGVTEIDVTEAVQLGGAYAFIDASLTYDEATLEEYSVRAAEDSGKLTLTTVGGASETVCTWDFGTDTSPDCPELRVDKTYDDANLKVNFEIIGARITNDTTSLKLAYSDDDFYLPSQTTTPLTAESLPTIEIDHAVRPNYNSGTVVFKVSGIGPIAQKYHVYDQVEGKVSADGTTWKTPVCVFGLPGSSGQCGGTVSETGEGGYKLDNWTVSSPADYFGNTAEYVKMTLQSSVYTNLNTDGAPSSQKQFGLETKLTMFDVLYAHGYDFLETNLTYDKETLSSYVPTGKIKVTFLNADGNPYPTQTSDYEFTVSAPVSVGLIDDIATNIRMEWGAHYTAYAEYLGDDIFRYCKSETVTITQEDDPTLSITNAMKKKDSSDGMNYLYALFKISNLGTLWDKYGIIDGYELRNYPITSRIIKYPAVDQRPGAMVIQPAGYQNDGTVTETETGTFLVKGLKLGIGAGVDSGTDLQVSLTTPYSTLIVSGITTYKEYSTIRTSRTLTGSHKFLVQDTHIFLTSTLHILDNEAKELYGIEPSGTVTYKAGDSTCTFTFPDGAIEATYKVKYGNCTVSVEPSYTAAGKKEFTIKVLDWHNVSSSPGSVEMTYSGDGIHDSCSIPAYLVPSTPAVTINSAIKTSPTTASVMFTIDNYFGVNTYKEFLVYDYIQIGVSGSGGSISKLVKIPSDGDSEIIGLEETINGLLRRNGNVFEIQDLEIKHSDYTNIFSTFHAGLASYETYNGTGLNIDVEKDFTISGFGTSLGSPASSGSGSPVSLSLELEP